MGFTAEQVVTLRMIFSALSLFAFSALPGLRFPKIHLRDWWIFAGTGILSFALSNYTYFLSIDSGAISVASVLMNSAPAFIMLISSVIFKDRLTKRKLVALAFSLSGCVMAAGLFTGSASAVSLQSVAFGVLSAFFYSLYSIFATLAVMRRYSSHVISAYTFLFATIGMLPFTLRTFPPLGQFPPGWIWPTIGIGLLSTALPYLFYTIGLSRVDSGVASVIATLEVVFTNTVGIVIFHEPFTLSIALGISCIVTAVFILSCRPDRLNNKTARASPFHRKKQNTKLIAPEKPL